MWTGFATITPRSDLSHRSLSPYVPLLYTNHKTHRPCHLPLPPPSRLPYTKHKSAFHLCPSVAKKDVRYPPRCARPWEGRPPPRLSLPRA